MANRAALIRQADLTRIFRAAKLAGVNVRVEYGPDGKVAVTTGKEAPAANGNSFDEMFQ